MENIKPLNFEAMMAGNSPASTAPVQPPASEIQPLTPVRYFTPSGIEQVEELLKTIRSDQTLHRSDVESLLEDPQYAKELPGFSIDRGRVFNTKLELCEYFIPLFGDSFLEQNRKNSGLWTWLALAYYPQFVKTKNGILQKTADSCWLYDPLVYRFGRRHYVAGPVYLLRDIHDAREEALQILFSRPVTEFGRFIDALTNVEENIRTPAFFGTAMKLYYDPGSKKHYKASAVDQNGAGSLRQLIRLFQHYAETFDFSVEDDVDTLCGMLPRQFDRFQQTEV